MKHRALVAKRWLKRNWWIVLLIAAFVAFLATQLWPDHSTPKMSLSDMNRRVVQHQVDAANVSSSDGTATITLKDGTKYKVTYPGGDQFNTKLVQTFEDNGVRVNWVAKSITSRILGFLVPFIPLVLLVVYLGVYAWYSKRKSTKEVVVPPKERFKDVGANKEVIERLEVEKRDIHECAARKKRGEPQSRRPNSVLLYGPPGTGKTLIARAFAGEAGLPFFYTSGPDLTAEYAGQSAAKVRNAFKRAETAAKQINGFAILFIDEIDAIGGKRSTRIDSATRDQDATLTQLIKCMDGFDGSNVIVVAATNRENTLDSALTRAGRLSRMIYVPNPDRAGRADIFRVYLERLNLTLPDERLAALAEITGGMAGSGIESLVAEADRVFRRRETTEGEQLTWLDFREAMLNERLGPKRVLDAAKQLLVDNSRREAAKVIVATVLPQVPNPFLVSAETRGKANGATLIPDHPGEVPWTIEGINQRLTFLMAGRAMEKLHMGGHTSASNADVENATKLAHEMVCRMDHDDTILRAVDLNNWRYDPQARDVMMSVNELLVRAKDRASSIIEQFKAEIESLAQRLVDAGGVLEAADLVDYRELKEATVPPRLTGFYHRAASPA